MNILSRRIGRFKISDFMIVERDKSTQTILDQCKILDKEYDMRYQVTEYIAINKFFDLIKIDESIPEYEAIVTVGNQISVSWHRV